MCNSRVKGSTVHLASDWIGLASNSRTPLPHFAARVGGGEGAAVANGSHFTTIDATNALGDGWTEPGAPQGWNYS
jgi:hypothetical protein